MNMIEICEHKNQIVMYPKIHYQSKHNEATSRYMYGMKKLCARRILVGINNE